jgi:hypothetical protein
MFSSLRVLILAALAFAYAPASAEDAKTGPSEMVLLTVSGTIGETNRGPLDPERDGLLAKNKIDFPKAFAFDRSMLLALQQGEVKAKPPGFDAPATFKGPLLMEVLGRIEAAKMKITFLGLDGHSGWLMPEDVDGSDWILALEANGAPLGIGQTGPLWLINTRAEGEKPDESGRKDWVWGVFYMKVEE